MGAQPRCRHGFVVLYSHVDKQCELEHPSETWPLSMAWHLLPGGLRCQLGAAVHVALPWRRCMLI